MLGPYSHRPSAIRNAVRLHSRRTAIGVQLALGDDGTGQTVAIIDAFDDPDAESDLFIFRNYFKLPVCSTLNGCFQKLNQRGKAHGTRRPSKNWAIEISLDLDMVSAACPNCNIMLIEANSSSWHDLGQSVNEAVKLGATIVRIATEESAERIASDYSHPGVVVLAAGSDSGFYLDRNIGTGRFSDRRRRRRNDADQRQQRKPWLDRDGMERHRKRLSEVSEAVVANRPRLQTSHRKRYRGGWRSGNRRRGLQ